MPHSVFKPIACTAFYFGGRVGRQIENPPQPVENQGTGTERVGFEPTVRLPAQRFSSSKIFVLARTAL